MSIGYEVEIGQGWYIDSSGLAASRPYCPGRPGLPVADPLSSFDPKQVSEGLSKFAKAMPDMDNEKSMQAFRDAGLTDEEMQLLPRSVRLRRSSDGWAPLSVC